METLLPKLLATAVLITVASRMQRRWGPAVGGLVAGLPLTSGPLLLYLALDHGPAFAAEAARGAFAELLAIAVFAAVYVRVASRGWVVALSVSIGGFLAVAGTLNVLRLPTPVLAALLLPLVALVLLRWTVSTVDVERAAGRGGTWSRIGIALTVTATGTLGAPVLGPDLTGLVAMVPVLSLVLCASTHRQVGPAAAIGFLRAVVAGLPACLGFFLVADVLLGRYGIGLAFGVATVVTAVLQTLLTTFLDRLVDHGRALVERWAAGSGNSSARPDSDAAHIESCVTALVTGLGR